MPAPQNCNLDTPAVAAAAWHDALGGAATDVRRDDFGFMVRTFRETPCAVSQPVLTDDILCLHGGGAKRVHRRHGGVKSVHDIEDGALTLMPRGQANHWQTFGPIDYTHLTPRAGTIGAFTREELDCDRESFQFRDDVGFRDPLVEMLFQELLQHTRSDTARRLYTDSLFASLIGRLVTTRSTLSARCVAKHQRATQSALKGGLSSWRLRRITEHLREHLADEVALSDLGAIAGVSRAQLFRAFRQSTGTTPARYLTDLRIEQAKALMLEGKSIVEVADATGFSSVSGLDSAFRRRFGLTSKQFVRNQK